MKVGHEIPVNSTAARVMGRGEVYESRKKYSAICQDVPPAMRKPTSQELGSQSWADLSGFRFGRFTVIAQAAEVKGWVVRCSCGNYSTRSAKSIRNPNNSTDCCEECRHLLYLKRSEIWRRTGKHVEWEELA
ncbi:hypothetical protein [Azotobacter chroococcum]|uniref:Uncharacterized protein n=1 Tax=Azotobacter chroococcum TaxID=353 RepID=A0A4R1P855_9GAMM|nr:hypothetical protein [Azotobacter chroococcum]TBV95288.1 hypothetical protein E0E53_13030 [Azotobacter chroococcum]TCL22084.1 hypothetical protein EV691_13533 [Azotobacter chroococcum]